MNILITGSNGNLGTKIIDTCLKKGHKPFATDFAVEPANSDLGKFDYYSCDIQENEKLQAICNNVKPDLIIHTAAITDVDLCEQEKELSRNVNIDSSMHIIDYACKNNCKLIFLSTDYVFDGETGNYTETDQTHPINFYGQTKLDVENKIIDELENHLIIRTSSLFGVASNLSKNFLLWILNKLKNNQSVPLFYDQIVNPTLTDNLANNIFELIENKSTGLYHLTGADQISRYDFGLIICDVFGYDTGLLEKVSIKDFDFAAKRPVNSSLCVRKFVNECSVEPFGVKEALNFVKLMLTQVI